MDGLSILEIWKFFTWLPNYVLRKVFTKQRMSDLLYVDLKPRGQSAYVNLGEPASFRLYLQVINMSPFDVELDRASFDFICAGVRLNTLYIRKTTFPAGKIGLLCVSNEINPEKANQIAKLYDKNSSDLELHCDWNCSLFSFKTERPNLSEVRVEFVNEARRLASVS